MSETTYTSKIVSVSHSDNDVYRILSNPENLRPLLSSVPESEFVDSVDVDADSIRVMTKQFGEVVMRVVDREENKTAKFAADNSPVPMNFWIQLKSTGDAATALRLTLRAELPMMLKMLAGDKIDKGIDRMADVLTALPYDKL
jgi:carbon monoxide dehydrogenase subunit G